MVRRDPYQVLGVDRSAGHTEIRKAYERLVLAYHPDKNPDDPEAARKLQEVVEAYRLLTDPAARAAYDAHGGPGPMREQGDFLRDFGQSIKETVSELFDEFFVHRGPAKQGRNIRCVVHVSLAEAMLGATKSVRFRARVTCPVCHGLGAKAEEPGALELCRTCGGSGRIRSGPALLGVTKTCPRCNGLGRIVRNPCPECGGAGVVDRERSVDVTIPVGVSDGALKKVAGLGEPGRHGGPPGDLIVEIRVDPHPLLVRSGDTVECTVPISMTQAALGAQVRVPTLEGSVLVRVPPGTQTGTVLKLTGRGGRRRDGTRADQLLHILVETPVDPTERQKALLEELEASLEPTQMPRRARFQEESSRE